jgi:hypothetical protein
LPPKNEVLVRLRVATNDERGVLAKTLDIKMTDDMDVDTVHLLDAYDKLELRAYGSRSNPWARGLGEVTGRVAERLSLSALPTGSYRRGLLRVAHMLAGRAGWHLPAIPDTADVEWIEDYIYEVFGCIHRPDWNSLSDQDKERMRQSAEQALRGNLPKASDQSNTGLVGALAIMGLAAGAVLGVESLASILIYSAVIGIASLFGSNPLDKLSVATHVLIHIRKRREFEAVLSSPLEGS